MSRPSREQFETDNAYYWALSDYYESEEGEAALYEAFKRGLRDGTAKVGPDAKAAGRAFLLEACGLHADSDISDDELMHIALHQDGSVG